MSVETLVISLDAVSRQHLYRALEDHHRWCRVNGLDFPAGLAQLAALLARDGQERPDPMSDPDLVDAPPVPVAYNYTEAGRVLSVSPRTVRRLVENDLLPVITVATGARRIHRDDLAAYADSLRRNRGAGVNAADRVGEGGEGRGSAPKTHLRQPLDEAS